LRFRSTIEINGINPYVRVSPRHAAKLQTGWRKPLPVHIRINAQPKTPWPINLMPVGDGSFYLYLHGDVRKASGTKVGDMVTVEVEFDAAIRAARKRCRAGSGRPCVNTRAPSKPEATDSEPAERDPAISLRPEVTRGQTRNTQRALRVLAGAQARFMARSWKMIPRQNAGAGFERNSNQRPDPFGLTPRTGCVVPV